MTEYYFPSQLIYLSLVLLLNTVIVEVVVCGVCSSVVNGRSIICIVVTCVCVGVISVVVHIGIVAVIHIGVITVVHIGVVAVVHVGVVAVVCTGFVEVLVLCAKKKDTALSYCRIKERIRLCLSKVSVPCSSGLMQYRRR